MDKQDSMIKTYGLWSDSRGRWLVSSGMIFNTCSLMVAHMQKQIESSHPDTPDWEVRAFQEWIERKEFNQESDTVKPFYLFSWPGYESGGLVDDFRGSYNTVEEAMVQDGLSEIGCIVETRKDGLWIVAEYSGWPPEWRMVRERLE